MKELVEGPGEFESGPAHVGIEELLKRSVVKDNPLYPVVKNPWDFSTVDLLVRANYFIGVRLNKLGAYDIALDYFEKVLSYDSSDRLTLINKAKSLIGLGQMKRAYRTLTQVQVICEKNLEDYKGIELVELVEPVEEALDLGDYEKELEFMYDDFAFSTEEYLAFNLIEIYKLKGFILWYMDDNVLSVEYYNKSLVLEDSISVRCSITLYLRGRSLLEIDRSESEAILDFQQVLKENGEIHLEEQERLSRIDSSVKKFRKTLDRIVELGDEGKEFVRDLDGLLSDKDKMKTLLYQNTRTAGNTEPFEESEKSVFGNPNGRPKIDICKVHLTELKKSGKRNSEIARILGVSEGTIRRRLIDISGETDC